MLKFKEQKNTPLIISENGKKFKGLPERFKKGNKPLVYY
jgi:hypothetical protein